MNAPKRPGFSMKVEASEQVAVGIVKVLLTLLTTAAGVAGLLKLLGVI